MKKIFIMYIMLIIGMKSIFADNMPTLFLDLGLSKSSVIAELGEPDSIDTDGNLIYITITEIATIETCTYTFNSSNILSKIYLSMALDYDFYIDYIPKTMSYMHEYPEVVMDYYWNKFSDLYGESEFGGKTSPVIVWRFDDGQIEYNTMGTEVGLRLRIISNRIE